MLRRTVVRIGVLRISVLGSRNASKIAGEQMAAAGQHHGTPASSKNPLILVVDDSAISRNVFVRALRRLGHRVIEAAAMKEAMAICRDACWHLDLLIAEFMLRDGNGAEVAAKVREHYPDLPVLLTCGTPPEGWSEAERRRSAELGADFIQKPFHISTLYLKVYQLLSVQVTACGGRRGYSPFGA